MAIAQIGEPVPVERGFTANDQVVLFEELQNDQESVYLLNGEVGMKIDSTVEFVLLFIKLHCHVFL